MNSLLLCNKNNNTQQQNNNKQQQNKTTTTKTLIYLIHTYEVNIGQSYGFLTTLMHRQLLSNKYVRMSYKRAILYLTFESFIRFKKHKQKNLDGAFTIIYVNEIVDRKKKKD